MPQLAKQNLRGKEEMMEHGAIDLKRRGLGSRYSNMNAAISRYCKGDGKTPPPSGRRKDKDPFLASSVTKIKIVTQKHIIPFGNYSAYFPGPFGATTNNRSL